MSQVPPSSTHVLESTVVNAPIAKVWELISSMNFSWWALVSSTALVTGPSSSTVGATHTISFKDGVTWTVQVGEISQINHTITFEV